MWPRPRLRPPDLQPSSGAIASPWVRLAERSLPLRRLPCLAHARPVRLRSQRRLRHAQHHRHRIRPGRGRDPGRQEAARHRDLAGRPHRLCQRPAEQPAGDDRPGGAQAAGQIALGESPEGVGISPDGRWVVAAVEETNDVAFVDTRDEREGRSSSRCAARTPSMRCSRPTAARLRQRRGRRRGRRHRRRAARQVGPGAGRRAAARHRLLAGRKRAYVAAENANEVYVIDAAAFKVLAKIKAGLRSNGDRGASRRQARLRLQRRRRDRVGDRPRHRHDRSRRSPSASGPGTWRSRRRQEALRRLRPLGQRLGDRHRTHVKVKDIAVGKLPWGVAIR